MAKETSEAPEPEHSLQGYEFVRPTGPIEKLQKLACETGTQSNVIVAASNVRKKGGQLMTNFLFEALRMVIGQHPALSIIIASKPSQTNKGHHRSWEARLKKINMEGCVTFINNFDDSEDGLQGILEENHNDRIDQSDQTKPLWRLVVLNGIHVLFVHHYIIGDGTGGVAFHRSLLAAFNKLTRDNYASTETPSLIVETLDIPLPREALSFYLEQSYKFSFLRAALDFIWLKLLRLCLQKKYWLFNDAVYPNLEACFPKDYTKVQKCSTKLKRMRLSSSTMVKCLKACKEEKTSFTVLLYTLIQVTLADLYSEALFSIVATQVDGRRFIKPASVEKEDNMRNMAAAHHYYSLLNSYRKVDIDTKLSPSLASTPSPEIDVPQFWMLAKTYKSDLDNSLLESKLKTPLVLESILSLSAMGEDDEVFAANLIPKFGVLSEKSFSLSNLGAFDLRLDDDKVQMGETESWQVDALEFSSAALKPAVGWMLYFAVISVKGGPCTINANYEDGTLEERKVDMLMAEIERRLMALLKNY